MNVPPLILPKVVWHVGYCLYRDIDFHVEIAWGLVPEAERDPYARWYRYGLVFGWQWLPELRRVGRCSYRLRWLRFFHFQRPRPKAAA